MAHSVGIEPLGGSDRECVSPCSEEKGWGKGIGTGAVRIFDPIAIGAR